MMPRSSSVKTDRVWNIFMYYLERFRGVLLFYGILLGVLGPLLVLVQFWAGKEANADFQSLLIWGIPLAVALVMPLLIFGYVNNRQALDVFHAAPIRRETFYMGGYLAGLSIVMLPLIVFGGLSVLAQYYCFEDGRQALFQLLNTAISAFSSYSLMVFVIINCGTMFESIVYYLALNVGYPVLIYALFSLLQQHTYGYQQTENLLQKALFSISPYYLLTQDSSWNHLQLFLILVPLVSGIILAVFGKHLYRQRKSEAAGQSFAYQPLFFVGAVMAALSAGIGFLTFSSSMGSINVGMVLVANLIGILAYAILDTIRNRGFRKVWRTAVTALCIAAGASGIMMLTAFTGAFGYENRIPALEQISQVQISLPLSLSDDNSYSYSSTGKITLETPESIALVLAFHQAMVDEKKPIRQYQVGEPGRYVTIDRNDTKMLKLIGKYDRYSFDDGRYAQSEYGRGGSVRLTYHLKDGSTLARYYSNYPFVLTKPLSRLLQTEEFRSKYYDGLLQSFSAESGLLEINSTIFNGYMTEEMDRSQVSQLQDAIRQDIEKRSDDFLLSPDSVPVYQLSMRVWKEDGYWGYTADSYIVYEGDGNTLALLRQWEALPELRTDIFEGTIAGYIPREKRDVIMNYPKRDAGIFYHAGGFALMGSPQDPYYSDINQEPDCYEPLFVTLTEEQYAALMEMITPIRLTETGGDVVIVGGINYLVLPQYTEDVRALILSASTRDNRS